MSLAAAALAILVLLVTPGPTNTLLALAGAERGWRGAVRLIPAELAGYLAVVAPLALLGAPLLAALPQARTALTLAAAAWVLWLAVAMWRGPRPGSMRGPERATVTGRRVLVTTLLNPKALVFGLVLLHAAGWGALAVHLALFALQVVGVAMLWALLGAALRARREAPGLPAPWRRAASLWLGALSLYLVGRVAGLA